MTLFFGLPAQAASGMDIQNVWNVCQRGAKGDGKSDDTDALKRALDSGQTRRCRLMPVGDYPDP